MLYLIYMAYTRDCKTCGQRISLRQMPDGQWVAFDVSTQNPHQHGRQTTGEDKNIYTKKTSQTKNVWSGDDDDMLEELFEEGKTITYIANYFKVSTTLIEAKLNKLGYINSTKKQKNNFTTSSSELWTDDEEEYLLEAKNQGITNYEIARELGRTEKAVERKYSKINNRTTNKQNRNYSTAKEDQKKVITDTSTITKYVYRAVENQNVIFINYETESNRHKSSRIIYPVKIHEYRQRKYVEAYCEVRKENRMFRISHITRLETINKTFAGNIYKSYMTYKPYDENTISATSTSTTNYNHSNTQKNQGTNYNDNYSSNEGGIGEFIASYWIVILIVGAVLYGIFS